jgi:hypothetical protein
MRRKGSPVKIRLLLALLALGGVLACASTQEKVVKPAPETEIVLLYNSDDKGEFEECG